MVSTFEPNQIGKYKLTLQSHIDLSLTPIPIEGAVSVFFFEFLFRMNNLTLGLCNDVLLKNEVLILLYVHFCANTIHVGHV